MQSAAIRSHGSAKALVREYAPIFFITVIGLFVRASSIGWHQFERDEAQCWAFATSPSIIDCIKNVAVDGNPPGIHVLLWCLIHTFGTSPIPAKLVTLLVSAALPPVAFNLFRRSLGEFGTLQFCTLLALSPILVRYCDLIRPYGALSILFLLSTAALLKMLTGSRSARVEYVCALTASLYLQLLSVILLAGHGLLVLQQLLTKKLSTTGLKHWVLATGLSLLMFAPWLSVVMQQLHQHLQPWNAPMTWSQLLIELHHALFLEVIWKNAEAVPWFVTLAFVLGMLPYRARGLRNEQWAIVFLGSIIAYMVLNQGFGMPFRLRYISILSPFALLFVSVFSARVYDLATKCSTAVGLLLFTVACVPAGWLIAHSILHLRLLQTVPESGVQLVVQSITPHINSSKDLVVVSPETTVPEVLRVLQQQHQAAVPVLSFPRIEGPPYIDFRGIDTQIRDDARMPKLFTRLQKTLQHGGSVWLVCTELESPCSEDELRQINSYLAIELLRTKQIHRWLAEHAVEDTQQWGHSAREDNAHAFHFSPRR